MMNVPGARHSVICARIARFVGNFVDEHQLGTILSNDGGIVTHRNPDSVRGADVAFYSNQRLLPHEVPEGYPAVAPELVFEVKSPTDQWKNLQSKVAEYLQAGVLTVCVVDPATESVIAYHDEQVTTTFAKDDSLTVEKILPGFSLPLKKIFK